MHMHMRHVHAHVHVHVHVLLRSNLQVSSDCDARWRGSTANAENPFLWIMTGERYGYYNLSRPHI